MFTLLTTSAGADDVGELKEAFDASARAEGRKPGEHTLVDQDGAAFNLSDLFGKGRPLVVSFIYTSCPAVCPAITAELKEAVEAARKDYGDRFNVLSIGFDAANDTPANLKKYAVKFGVDPRTYAFAAADEETIKRITAEFGFYYRKKEDGSFDHIDMVSVLRPDGTIYRQVYSLRTQGSELKARIGELMTGRPAISRSASIVERLKYFCYKYDPVTGRYVIDYPVIAGAGIQFAIIAAIIYLVWGRRVNGKRGS